MTTALGFRLPTLVTDGLDAAAASGTDGRDGAGVSRDGGAVPADGGSHCVSSVTTFQ